MLYPPSILRPFSRPLFVPSGGGSPPGPPPVTSGLIADWISDNYTAGSQPDSSGNGFTCTQSNGAKEPTLVSNVLNGHPALRFDGTTSEMDVPTLSGSSNTIFWVGKWAGASSFPNFCNVLGEVVDSDHAFRGDLGSNRFRNNVGSFRINGVSGGAITTAGYVLVTCSGLGLPPAIRMGNGAGGFWQGDFFRTLLYTSLGSTDTDTVESFLMSEYAL